MNQAANPSFNEKFRNKVQKFAAFSGTVTRIEDFSPNPSDVSEGCYKLMSLENKGILFSF